MGVNLAEHTERTGEGGPPAYLGGALLGAAGGACLGVLLAGTPWAAIGGMVGGLGAGLAGVTYVTEVMGRKG
jgi:hypothetical protein